jgi:predicted TIM-barrel enzyme
MAASSIASSLGRTIKNVTVIGGGLMGSGIAQASFSNKINLFLFLSKISYRLLLKPIIMSLLLIKNKNFLIRV